MFHKNLDEILLDEFQKSIIHFIRSNLYKIGEKICKFHL